MSGLTKTEKAAKRERNKRPTHHDLTNSQRNRTAWDGRFGPVQSNRVRPYRGKSERREVITLRRSKRGTVRGAPAKKICPLT